MSRSKLYIGLSKQIEVPKGGCLFLDDAVRQVKRARVFDPLKHNFNPLKDIDYRKAREIADTLYTVSPQGENTLTVRDGKRAMLRLLLEGGGRFDRLPPVARDDKGGLEALSMVEDMLRSPVLKRVLCNPTNFSFNPRSTIFARVDRAELGDFDALVLGLLLMAHFKGPLVVVDGGFYLREAHVGLIRQGRLIVGVNTLAELSPKLRQAVLLIPDKVASGATAEDAETLATYRGLVRGTLAFNDYVSEVLA